MSRILVVGDVVDDTVVRPLSAVTEASDTDAQIRVRPGGSAANVAAWLGHLGASVVFVGRTGARDVERHREALERFGVDAQIVPDPDRVTGAIVLVLDEAGERTMYVDRGANASLESSDIPASVWVDVGWLHLTGYSLFDAAVRPTALGLIVAARGRGAGVSIDPSSVGYLRRCGADTFRRWARGADLLLPNADEANELTGRSEPDRAAEDLADDGATVLTTLGQAGSLLRTAGGALHRAAPVEVEVVDTTGAGDAYCAGFLAGWTGGSGPAACMRAGARAAAQVISTVGARPGPDPDRGGRPNL